MTRFIRSGSLTGFPEIARKCGLDPVSLMQEFGLPAGCLDETDIMIPVDSVARLVEAAADRSGTEAFGLLMAEARTISSLGPLGLFAREQPTLRDAIAALTHYARLLNEALIVTIEEDHEIGIVREELLVGHSGSVRQATELAIGLALKLMRSFLGPDWKPRRACFMHAAPRDRSVHLRFFGHAQFDQDFNGIVCTRRELDAPNREADATLARYARQMLESHPAKGGELFADQIRQLVVMQLGSGQCSIERIAHLLRVDRRTIHRRLRQEGQSFSATVDAVRRELASRYLADRKRSLAQISSLLGFSAPSGFSRWHKQQFGTTAEEVRGAGFDLLTYRMRPPIRRMR